jgi:hypothetical protein
MKDLYDTVRASRLACLIPGAEPEKNLKSYYTCLVDEKCQREKLEILRAILGYKPNTWTSANEESKPGAKHVEVAFRDASAEYEKSSHNSRTRRSHMEDTTEVPTIYQVDAPETLTQSKEILEWEFYHLRLCAPHRLKWRSKQLINNRRDAVLPKLEKELKKYHEEFQKLETLCKGAGVEWFVEEEWKNLEAFFAAHTSLYLSTQ